MLTCMSWILTWHVIHSWQQQHLLSKLFVEFHEILEGTNYKPVAELRKKVVGDDTEAPKGGPL